MIVTRFAPSPTGTLHIGSVRTILFNWLYARANNGKFLLRIEDTDKERSKSEHVQNIFNTLKLLGLDFDEEVVFQSQRMHRHQEVATKLLQEGQAYKCYCTQEELEFERERARQNGETPKYNRKCRNLTQDQDKPYTIRLKTDLTGELKFTDLIQGECCVQNEHMDDMILLRSDGTPTYMLAVVVDDFDMGVTDVIRGTEHLNNAYRQLQIYKACNFQAPNFAHVSLIHGEDGSKLSKRTGAKSVEEYQSEGFFKEAILNYLLRLGWSYGEEEIISMEDAKKIFDIRNVRSSCARFSLDKLLSVNSIYLKNYSNEELIQKLKHRFGENAYSQDGWHRILKGMEGLKSRSRTLIELKNMSDIYGNDENYFQEMTLPEQKNLIIELINLLPQNHWTSESQAEIWFKDILETMQKKLKEVAPIIRIALTKSPVSPSLFDVLFVLNIDLVRARLSNAIKS